MLRANNVISATSSTGSGPFTLAAAPTALGALDLYTAFAAQGFGTSQPIPVPLVITEYTDGTFATPKQKQGFMGGVTLGASLAATTVAVTTVLWTQTGLNTDTPAYAFNAPTAISIGVAANTLIECDPDAFLGFGYSPFIDSTHASGWVCSAGTQYGADPAGQPIGFAEYLTQVILAAPLLAKRMGVMVPVGQVGGTGGVYLRLYAKGANGLPGKLICDYTGSTPQSLIVANGTFVSATSSAPPYLPPGVYYSSISVQVSGVTTNPKIGTWESINISFPCDGTIVDAAGAAAVGYSCGWTSAPAPDPYPSTGHSFSLDDTYGPIAFLKAS